MDLALCFCSRAFFGTGSPEGEPGSAEEGVCAAEARCALRFSPSALAAAPERADEAALAKLSAADTPLRLSLDEDAAFANAAAAEEAVASPVKEAAVAFRSLEGIKISR